MSVSPARRAAFETLLRVFEEDAYADRAFPAAAAGLDPRDRALAQRLAYGTIQRVRTLDHGIETLGRRPVRKLDPPVRAALRLGAYQLAFSEVAAHAAVNESVELVRSAGLQRAVAFTNAILRRLALGLRDLVAALPEGSPGEAALRHSYPDWVAETWWREHGPDEALALMRAQNEPPETVVRLNPRKAGTVEGTPDAHVPGALHVDRVDEDAFRRGLIWPQSVASQLAGICVASHEGERVLDLCAAPGGKATQLAGEVVAVEKHPGRARQLEENRARLAATNVRVVNADALALPAELRDFDRALVDAPCSGLGVLASRPDLRWRAEPLPELQLALMRAAAERVRAGGTIVYSVCTINAEENEAIVDALGLEAERLGEEWPQFAHPRRPEFLLTLPHRHRTSGFFVARVRT
ncbi:MAG TPA: transcription antitermination factor NusB [Gaiellaceae bacterium]|jgi:16S rRNA (cytosine967-C5)-methyltransferase|nr:transcription antitermination factor NusB [Gaiellaceae bacterium]